MSPRELRAGLSLALVIFFAGCNVLEAKLTALVSRAALRAATGVYSSVQFLGTFLGGARSMGDFMPAAAPASRTWKS